MVSQVVLRTLKFEKPTVQTIKIVMVYFAHCTCCNAVQNVRKFMCIAYVSLTQCLRVWILRFSTLLQVFYLNVHYVELNKCNGRRCKEGARRV